MLTLSMRSFVAQVDRLDVVVESYPYLYDERSMVKLFLYSLIRGITSFKSLRRHLQERPEVLKLVGLATVPHRTTLSRRFKRLSTSLSSLLGQLHQRFVLREHTDPTVMSFDSTLMQANGNLWHAKDMKAGKLPRCGNIDTEAHWGVSGAGEWIFGYRLHCAVSCCPSGHVLPHNISVHAANRKDARVFKEELATSLPQETLLALGDSGYDDKDCYALCDKQEVSLLAPVKVKKNTPPERQQRAILFHSTEAKEVYALRKTTVEPFQGQLKNLFGLEYLPLKGLLNVRTLATLAAVAYALLVMLNLRLQRPATQLKATMLALR